MSLERSQLGARYSFTIGAAGAQIIANPVVGLGVGIRPEVSLCYELDPAGARCYIDDGAGAAINWHTDTELTFTVANFASAFRCYLQIRLPGRGSYETVAEYTIS